ncbi:hypothetical protein WM40_25150, partial [Robbsia andropogonis]
PAAAAAESAVAGESTETSMLVGTPTFCAIQVAKSDKDMAAARLPGLKTTALSKIFGLRLARTDLLAQ